MKVLVMGGTRFNGLALVHELVRDGHEVTMFNRGKSDAEVPGSVRRLYGDRHEHAALAKQLANETFDCVQDISAYTLEDVQGLLGALDGRFGHYVFASSTLTYAHSKFPPITETHPSDRTDAQSAYGMHKLLCEDWLFAQHNEHGLPVTIAAFSMVFGPNNIIPDREQRMFVRLLQKRPVLIPGDGTTLGQIGHVDDQARALRMMMLNPVTYGQKYNLTGADYFTDEGYVDTCAQAVGYVPRKVFVPHSVMDELHEQDNACNRYLVQRVAPYVHPWDESVLFSSDRLRKDIGWEPQYDFAAAVAQTYDWFASSGLADTRDFDFAPEDKLLARLGAT